jgi:hypothetical protein
MKRFVLYTAVAVAVVAATVVKFVAKPAPSSAQVEGFEFPATFCGRTLREVGMTEAERRFYARLPGTVKQFETSEEKLLVRYVIRSARELHPASECYLANGATLEYPGPVVYPAPEFSDVLPEWSRFVAELDGTDYEVTETVISTDGAHRYRDIQEWYWKCATGGEDKGPWIALTRQVVVRTRTEVSNGFDR